MKSDTEAVNRTPLFSSSLPTRKEILDTQFERFDRENPHIWEMFVNATFEVIRAGYRNYSARTIVEVLRWRADTRTTGPDYKIANTHIPRYARKFMREYPRYRDFFRTTSHGD